MSIFNKTNFERQGNTENDLNLKSTEDVCSAIIDISETVLRSIKIFTPDMEHLLYNNEAFRQNILNFVRGNRHAQVQILVTDSESAIKHGHQLIRLSQQLTTAIKIKNTPEEYRDPNISFILLDQTSFIYKAHRSKQPALMSNCKYRTEKLDDFFTLAWEQAVQDPKTLSIHI